MTALQPFDGRPEPEDDPDRVLADWRDLVAADEQWPDQADPELTAYLAEHYKTLTGHAPSRR